MFDFLVYSWIFSIYGSTDSRKVQLYYTAALKPIYALHCALRDPLVSDIVRASQMLLVTDDDILCVMFYLWSNGVSQCSC